MCRISSKPLPFTTIGTTLLHPKNTSSPLLTSSPPSSLNVNNVVNNSSKERLDEKQYVDITPSTDPRLMPNGSTHHDNSNNISNYTIPLPNSDRVYQTAIIEPYDSQLLDYIFRNTDSSHISTTNSDNNNTKTTTYHCVTKLPLLSLPSLIENEFNEGMCEDESKYNDNSCSNNIDYDTTTNHTMMDDMNTIKSNTNNIYGMDQYVYETPPSSPSSKSMVKLSNKISLSPPPPPDHYHHRTIIDISTLYHSNKNNPFDIYLPFCNDEQKDTTTHHHPNYHLFLPMVL
jgi:hypothetical protein